MRVSLAAHQNAVNATRIGAKILHGVDATRLDKYFNTTQFSAIVFNFPNVASRIPVYGHNPNHNLMRRFLRSAAQQLARNGRVIITVVDAPFYSGAFGLAAAAKFAGYKEPDVYEFKLSHFSGYAHANTLGGQSALTRYRNVSSWVFQLP
ncbi:Rossmann-like fold-containing protein [Pelagibacterium sp.]|uniref:Rossmann-like fold-containing protein n=1 Tax=Pelagibacterium sp. TaxID=1967288 RepID=UPI003BADB376